MESERPSQPEEARCDVTSDLSSSADLQRSCMEEKEHSQVYLRIRPLTPAERSRGEAQDCVTMETADTVLSKPPSSSLSARLSREKSLPQTGQRFQFSKVYGPETTQSESFDGTVRESVGDVSNGGSSSVFTYGVTNSGKTFTFLGPDCDAGVVPRSLQSIFSSIQGAVSQDASVKPQRCSEFTASSPEQQAEEASVKRGSSRQLRENEKCSTSSSSATNQTSSEGSTSTAPEDRVGPEVKDDTKFSVWVSFCEIYNENIHDSSEAAPSGAPRRAASRSAQDADGSAYVKDSRWVQVSSAEEAYRVVKVGRRNQSFSSTRLNQLSSRSHSIFSVRISSVDASGPPRVHSMGELCLCDSAGSERCAKTRNHGERSKEAGNINTSSSISGKCIKASRYKQQARLSQHVPFRESKSTHYSQGFFCGRGKACMIVNINQCASMYDETLNVLKFSAVAQKVVVSISKPLPIIPTTARKRSSWESSSSDDVQDDEEDEGASTEDDGDESEKILVSKRTRERQVASLKQSQVQSKKERADNMSSEARVREETSREFSQLFSDMQKDFDERSAREREISEERAERRSEIFKNSTEKMSSSHPETADGPSSSAASPRRIGSDQSGEKSRNEPEDQQNREDEENEEGKQHRHLQGGLQQPEESQEEMESGSTRGSVRDKDNENKDSSSHGDQSQEASAELQKEKTKREEMSAASEYQTSGKEEASASLQEERRAREEAAAASQESRQKEAESSASSEIERRGKEEKSQEILDQSCQIHVSNQELQKSKEEISQSRRSSEEEKATKQKSEQESKEATHKSSESDQQGEQSRRAEEKVQESKTKSQEQEEAGLKLKKDLEEAERNGATSSSSAAESQRVNSDLHGEVGSSREQSEEAQRQLGASQESSRAAEEQRQEEVQEARRKEAERRREVSAVAHEAVAEKEAESERKVQEISRSKEGAQQEKEESQKLRSTSQRKEEEEAESKGKMADYKKQVQQVQKEISAMREEERVSRQRSTDADKAKKQSQSDLSSRDRTIQQLRAEQAERKPEPSQQLYQKACEESEAKQRVIDDMRSASSEQEETQEQMERASEEKMGLLQELFAETERSKAKSSQQNLGDDGPSENLKSARDEAQENSKTVTEKHQAERRKWQEEKSSSIGQAKEAEDKRNQEMRKFAEDRERYSRQQSLLESKSEEKEQAMESWRKERDASVAASEVQSQKLSSSQAEKDKVIKESQSTQPPAEVTDGAAPPSVAESQAALTEREAEIRRSKGDSEASRRNQTPAVPAEKSSCEASNPGRRETRASASSRGSSGFPSVLESSEISTENGRTSRFPRPESEISFSPSQPNRVASRRQGEDGAVTVKITRSARKRKSGEMEKQEEVETENRRNTRAKLTPKSTPQKEEGCSPARRHDSQSGTGGRKDGTSQKIGDSSQCSPTSSGSKAKKMMSSVSGRLDADSAAASSSSLSSKTKRGKKKLYRPEISCPMEMPPHPMINQEADDRESDHSIMKWRLRSRVAKC